MKKVLVLGATGAMGKYLIPYLSEMNYQVDAAAIDDSPNQYPNVNFIKADCYDHEVLDKLLSNNYDAIVDFLIYNTGRLVYYLPKLLASTDQYIYLASYRVFDNKEIPVVETSPRLIDTSEDIWLKNSDDYGIYKARGEDILASLPNKNWTSIRPAITYSLMRYQLVTLEAHDTVGRAKAGKKVVLPIQAKDIQATMSWAGDVARMIARLLFNEKALGERFNVTTAEHHTWGEIADYYKDICNLDALWVDKEDYIKIRNSNIGARWQLDYDRLFTRIMDNSKILTTTNMQQSELMKLYDGLKYEINRCPNDVKWNNCDAMDKYLENM